MRQKLETIDPSRDCARVQFNGAKAEALPGARGWHAVEHVLDRAAILFAFEQIGGAQTCLDMARDYALQRHAFGRQIGSFQAIKHKLADVYVAIELARSNAYYGAWALSADAPDLTSAAAAARVAASAAYELAAQEKYPDAWRHGLHLGDGLPFVLSPVETFIPGDWGSAVLERPADRRHRTRQRGLRLNGHGFFRYR